MLGARVKAFFKLNSLRRRLLLLVALALAPTAAMTLLNGYQERARAIHVAQENLQRLSNLAAANEAQSIARARQILQDVSSIPDLLADQSSCTRLLQTILQKNPGYTNFGLIRLNGDVSCSAVPSPHLINLADRAHFQRAVLERRFIASNYVFGRLIQKHTINLTYPVTNGRDEVVAVVFAALDLSELDKFVGDLQLPPGSLLLTADSQGAIIARRPDPQQWLGKPVSPEIFAAMRQPPAGPKVLAGPDGMERLHTFARVGPSELSDYTVSIGIPRAVIVAAASRDQWRSLLGLAASSALALLATWLAGDLLIVRRIRTLVRTADRIASGSLTTRTGLRYGSEEIGQLARSLDDMAAALQRKEDEHQRAERQLRAADKRKDEFLAMLAHELRNPLAPISTGAQLLKLGHADNPAVARTADIIARQVEHMTRLVDDLLDVSRVTRGLVTLGKELLDLKQLIGDAVEQIDPLIATRRHTLRLQLPAAPAGVYGDRKRLVQVVANLLNNAAKYTLPNGRITLSLELAGDGAAWLLSVADNGIGMPAEFLERVFDLFAQAERTPDRSQGGLGLGLALVKSLVELHGGSVTAHSEGSGLGSRFTVRLPHSALPLAPPAPALALGAGEGAGLAMAPASLRILVVDDNVDAVHMLNQFLGAAGHQVTLAYRAGDGLALARNVAPQLCLLDIGLPDFDGKQLARRLRGMPETASATLVAISGYGRREDREAALAAGFDHYFVKPLDLGALQRLLADVPQRALPSAQAG